MKVAPYLNVLAEKDDSNGLSLFEKEKDTAEETDAPGKATFSLPNEDS